MISPCTRIEQYGRRIFETNENLKADNAIEIPLYCSGENVNASVAELNY